MTNVSGKRKKTRTKRVDGVVRTDGARIAGINRGLLSEFIIFLLLQGFDLFSNTWVLNQAVGVLTKVKKYENDSIVSTLNNTIPAFCSSVHLPEKKVDEEVEHFSAIVYLYIAFLAVTVFIFTLHLLSWLYTLQLSFKSRRGFNSNTQTTLIRMKVYFLIAASILEDIPLSAISAELFSLQQGQQGLVCWYCKVSGLCSDAKQLQRKINRSRVAMWLNFTAIGMTSLWKGISSFYRWTRIDYCQAFFLRACTSVFFGGLFSIAILTPPMTVLKYRYFVRPGIDSGLLMDIIDRVYVVGAIMWVIILAAVFCCPLLNFIRVSQ